MEPAPTLHMWHDYAAALNGELDNALWIEVAGVGREAGAGAVFDALVNRKDAEVAGFTKPPVVKHRLQIAQGGVAPVAGEQDTIDKLRAGEIQLRPRDGSGVVIKQRARFVSEDLNNAVDAALDRDSHAPALSSYIDR